MDRYALRDHDDRIDGEGTTWWLYFDARAETPYISDIQLEQAERPGWWRVPSYIDFDPITTIVVLVGEPKRRISRYRRIREVGGYPETLTLSEYADRTDDESAVYDPLVRPLYESEYAFDPPTRTPVDRPFRVLDGAPFEDDGGPTWIPTLPSALRAAPQYGHLFPGYFDHFREALCAALDVVPGVQAHSNSATRGYVSVYVKVELPRRIPLRWDARPKYEGRTRAERKRLAETLARPTETINRHFEIAAPHRIEGQDRASALVDWNGRIAECVEYVTAAVAEPCPTCKGRGYIEPHAHEED